MCTSRTNTGADRRDFSRIPVAVEVELQLADDRCVRSTSNNVSMNGLLVDCGPGLPLGPCDVRISLGGGALTIEARGEVVRSDERGVGVHFVAVELDSFHHLRSLLLCNSSDPSAVGREFDSHLGLRRRD